MTANLLVRDRALPRDAAQPDAVIEARGLVKKFGRTTGLDGLDLVVPRGQVVALLGPNGAGKTTFVRSVATLLKPDSGSLLVCGFDAVREPHAVRGSIGLAGQFAAVEAALTGRENIEMVARLVGLDRRAARASAGAILEQFGLGDAADRLVRTYSGGMRRKLDLGASLVGNPRLLLLDEPTTGLDPRSRMELWQHIRALVAAGTDVLLTTQYLDEADHLASQVVIVDHGRAVASGTPADLKRRIGGGVLEVRVGDSGDLGDVARVLAAVAGGEPEVDRSVRRVRARLPHRADGQAGGLRAVMDLRDLEEVSLRQPTLEEVFLALTGHRVEADASEEKQ
jgi:ABC-2 type transport system ATP-binding protein